MEFCADCRTCRFTRPELMIEKRERVAAKAGAAAEADPYPRAIEFMVHVEAASGAWLCSDCGHRFGSHPPGNTTSPPMPASLAPIPVPQDHAVSADSGHPDAKASIKSAQARAEHIAADKPPAPAEKADRSSEECAARSDPEPTKAASGKASRRKGRGGRKARGGGAMTPASSEPASSMADSHAPEPTADLPAGENSQAKMPAAPTRPTKVKTSPKAAGATTTASAAPLPVQEPDSVSEAESASDGAGDAEALRQRQARLQEEAERVRGGDGSLPGGPNCASLDEAFTFPDRSRCDVWRVTPGGLQVHLRASEQILKAANVTYIGVTVTPFGVAEPVPLGLQLKFAATSAAGDAPPRASFTLVVDGNSIIDVSTDAAHGGAILAMQRVEGLRPLETLAIREQVEMGALIKLLPRELAFWTDPSDTLSAVAKENMEAATW
eukprot:CAMPEP_0174844234 /NCGR_PEP_ID=MMETSP1114-20130205/10975_1 /TAXON_ID=312471 /ORGANISM="Neobodo designis, Strain CCAP 1951/1" /LENGTH=438 /DNA_ID=CAMNT_0016078469 /DNA_START=30 /DNA_END=1346 /DNA_ORIENTATION=+